MNLPLHIICECNNLLEYGFMIPVFIVGNITTGGTFEAACINPSGTHDFNCRFREVGIVLSFMCDVNLVS